MIDRLAAVRVREALAAFPAVLLVGPRQCGKTTLARSLASRYFDMERDEARVAADATWPSIEREPGLVVFDEAQEAPEVFRRLRGSIDDDRRRNGRFLLLGSVRPALMGQIAESLAGRLGIVELTPLLSAELPPDRLDAHWLLGGFPDGGIVGASTFPRWHDAYLRLMAERDLPAWGLPAKPRLTLQLFRMLAALHGSLLNATQLGASLGITHPTVRSYLDFLDGAWLVRLLPSWQANLKKRIVKAPKVYLRDSGLLHALIGLDGEAGPFFHPMAGLSWEGFVIEQIVSTRQARGERVTPWFFRTHDGHEADLVLESAGRLELIEIKLTTGPAPQDLRRLESLGRALGAFRVVLLSRVEESALGDFAWSTNLGDYLGR